jgi:hypothetical protein
MQEVRARRRSGKADDAHESIPPLELSVGVPLDAKLSIRSMAACFLPLLRRMLFKRLKIIVATTCAPGRGGWLGWGICCRHWLLVAASASSLFCSRASMLVPQSFCTPTDCELPAVTMRRARCVAAIDNRYVNIDLVGQKAVRLQVSREGLLASQKMQYRRACRAHYRCTKRAIV